MHEFCHFLLAEHPSNSEIAAWLECRHYAGTSSLIYKQHKCWGWVCYQIRQEDSESKHRNKVEAWYENQRFQAGLNQMKAAEMLNFSLSSPSCSTWVFLSDTPQFSYSTSQFWWGREGKVENYINYDTICSLNTVELDRVFKSLYAGGNKYIWRM